MDFVSGGSLHHFLKKRPNRRTDDPLAKRLFFQVGAVTITIMLVEYLVYTHILYYTYHTDFLLERSNYLKRSGTATTWYKHARIKAFLRRSCELHQS